MRLFSICITLLFTFTSPAAAAPGDPWEGVWRAHNDYIMTLAQDGNRVYGDYGGASSGRVVEGRLSPDGRIFRGAWLYPNGDWGLMSFELAADNNSFDGSWTRGATLASTEGTSRWSAVRLPEPAMPLVTATGPGPFWPPELDVTDPEIAMWVSFGADQGIDPIDISNLPVPAPGNAGLWQVLNRQDQQVGTVGLDQSDTGFVATGQIRLPRFQGGTPLLATFTDTSSPFDTLELAILAGDGRQTVPIYIRPGVGESYDVRFDGSFLGDDDYAMRLVWIEGSIPPAPAIDISDLAIPTPGTLGLMRVFMDGVRIGTVNWDQPETTVTMTGQIVLPRYTGNTPWDIQIVDNPGIGDDSVMLSNTVTGASTTFNGIIEARDGDQYFVDFKPGTLDPAQTTAERITISHIQGSRPDTPPQDLRLLRIDTARVPAGLAVTVHDAPRDDAPVIGMLDRTATDLRLQSCDPAISDDQLRLMGIDLIAALASRYCLVTAPAIEGWVNGAFLTR